MQNPFDGERHRLFVTNLIGCLVSTGLRCELTEARWGADEAPREVPEDTILFSYHSVGTAKNIWRLKEAPVPPLYAFDRTGHSGWSEIATSRSLQMEAEAYDLAAAREVIAYYRNRFLVENISKYPQPDHKSALPDCYAFLALQVQNDPVARFAFIDTISLITESARLARETSCHLVIKRHPFCTNPLIGRLLEELAQENPWVRISKDSVHHLIRNARSVITINSGVGLEALIHGKPVYAAGLSEWTPVAIQVRQADALARAFDRQQPELEARNISYVGYLLKEYWVDSTDFAAMQRKVDQCVQCYDRAGDNSRAFSMDGKNLEYALLLSNAKLGELKRQERALDYIYQLAQKDRLDLAETREALNRANQELRETDEALRISNTTLYSLEEGISQLRRENSDLKSTLLDLKNSTSWKVTAPIRLAKQLVMTGRQG